MSRHNPANPADPVPVKRLAFNPATGTHEVRAHTEKFIKGPIPLDWISRANALPGKAGSVDMALWLLVGIQGSRTVKLTGEVERIAGCDRKAVYQALDVLAAAGLIGCNRKAGPRAVVTLLESDCASSGKV